MIKIITIRYLCFIFSVVLWTVSLSAEEDEYRTFSRVALDSVLRECDGELHDYLKDMFIQYDSLVIDRHLWEEKSFADISVAFSKNSTSRARSHKCGYTVYQQLSLLTPIMIENAWNAVESKKHVFSLERRKKNVMVNYLLHHLMAMRFAHQAGEGKIDSREDLRFAFIFEAIALSYLVDAFSSNQMLIDYRILSAFQCNNYCKAREFYRTKGAYVINSKGDVWQTFGDKLMLWYEPTYRFTLDACRTSLRELLLVFYTSIDPNTVPQSMKSFKDAIEPSFHENNWLEACPGDEYYTNLMMPSLLCLPMPITASWSIQTEDIDENDIQRRRHYPQLHESGFHDPDLERKERKCLYHRGDVPDWLIAGEFLENAHPEAAREIVRKNPDITSVRYVQQRSFPPSYVGLILNAAGGVTFNGKGRSIYAVGLGAGFLDSFWLLRTVSADMHYLRIPDNNDSQFITTTIGTSIQLSLPRPLQFIKSLRLETGHAWQNGEHLDAFHYKSAWGLEGPSFQLGFTYAGITPRIMAYRIYTGSAYHGIYFQIAVY